jgi:hypothetical protein
MFHSRKLLQTVLLSMFVVQAGRSAEAPVADFSLMDVNPQSARGNTPVSPRDYILQVSGYYFGHAS